MYICSITEAKGHRNMIIIHLKQSKPITFTDYIFALHYLVIHNSDFLHIFQRKNKIKVDIFSVSLQNRFSYKIFNIRSTKYRC